MFRTVNEIIENQSFDRELATKFTQMIGDVYELTAKGETESRQMNTINRYWPQSLLLAENIFLKLLPERKHISYILSKRQKEIWDRHSLPFPKMILAI